MLIVIITFLISWSAFLFLANKRKIPLFLPTIYMGIILALISDLLMFVYPLWDYPGTKLEEFTIQLLNGFGIYLVAIYFFLQLLPEKQTVLTIMRYIFIWSLFTIILEKFYLSIHFIEHGLWWNTFYSYLADWLLFTIFYFHHKWILKHSAKKYY